MQPSVLWIAYIANILILVPVCWSMFIGGGVGAVFDGRVAESAGLRIMVASLWVAILIASFIGLFLPNVMAPVLLIQIIYKSLWLLVFVRPGMKLNGWESVPHGITICFLAIVLTYPFILGAHLLRASDDLTQFSHEVTTSAPASDVWALWTKPETWHCWDKGLETAEGPSPLALNNEGSITAQGGTVAKFQVTEMDDGKSYTFDTALPLATLRVRREITQTNPTGFKHSVSFHGFMKGPFSRMLAPDFKTALPPTMENIAAIAEGSKECNPN